MVVCLLMTGAICSDAKVNATNTLVKSQVEQSGYKYKRTIKLYYFVSGRFVSYENGVKFRLVEDRYGRLFVECTTKYGKSYHPAVLSSSSSFKYAVYMAGGWNYFN